MHIAAAEHATDGLVRSEQEPAAFLRGGLAGMGEDLLAEPPGQGDARAIDQRPPAIAGITMISLPSGTFAPAPPRARASSSPI